ncbi:unnamed protein product [Ambrosiozyma monospora]|uniref:Unnamed protein product n=1 Tax=Ambrosiozyma monospora TaxID=43982 RepID=A0ACB5SZT6_AMBMO|nr:unnamed protein product [Ambrosiozyma monospora]
MSFNGVKREHLIKSWKCFKIPQFCHPKEHPTTSKTAIFSPVFELHDFSSETQIMNDNFKTAIMNFLHDPIDPDRLIDFIHGFPDPPAFTFLKKKNKKSQIKKIITYYFGKFRAIIKVSKDAPQLNPADSQESFKLPQVPYLVTPNCAICRNNEEDEEEEDDDNDDDDDTDDDDDDDDNVEEEGAEEEDPEVYKTVEVKRFSKPIRRFIT